MKHIEIKRNDAGQRVDKFLGKAFPNLPQSMMYKAIRTKNIKLNRKRCQISDRLCEGDVLDIYLPDDVLGEGERDYDFLHAGTNLTIAYEDEHILIADKRPGVLVHPDEHYQADTLIARIQRYLYEKGEYNPEDENSFAPALCNRIDRNTGGLVIAAKTAAALRVINLLIKRRLIHKHYLCIVHGRPKQAQATLTGWLEKDESIGRVYVSTKEKPGAKQIRTRYRVLESRGQLSLLEVDLLTGRTHQIRAHMASIGHPLLGDGKYGRNEQNKRYGMTKQALYSFRLMFDFDPTDEEYAELAALNGLSVEVSDIPFVEQFRKGEFK